LQRTFNREIAFLAIDVLTAFFNAGPEMKTDVHRSSPTFSDRKSVMNSMPGPNADGKKAAAERRRRIARVDGVSIEFLP